MTETITQKEFDAMILDMFIDGMDCIHAQEELKHVHCIDAILKEQERECKQRYIIMGELTRGGYE